MCLHLHVHVLLCTSVYVCVSMPYVFLCLLLACCMHVMSTCHMHVLLKLCMVCVVYHVDVVLYIMHAIYVIML